MKFRRRGIRAMVLGLLAAAGLALAPAAFAAYSVGINAPGVSVGYYGGHHHHGGYLGINGGYYSPGYFYEPAYYGYAPAYYNDYYYSPYYYHTCYRPGYYDRWGYYHRGHRYSC